MSSLSICRVCLKDNMRMLPIGDTPYQEIYERHTATKLTIEHSWPLLVCYLCASQLRKFKRFVELSQRNEVQLSTLVQSGIQLSTNVLTQLVQVIIHNYSISAVNHTSVSDDDTSDSYDSSPVSYVKKEQDLLSYKVEISVKPEQVDELLNIEDAPPCFVRSLSPASADDFKYDPDPRTQTKSVLQKTKTTLKRETYPCEYCEKILKTEKSLKQHLKTHSKKLKENRTRKGQNSCKKCEKNFANSSLFRSHMRMHKPFECDQCLLMFRRKDELNRHVEIHTREKPFACTECGEKFLKKYTLKRHMTIHTQKPLHTCEICNQHFIYKSRLAVHAQSHTDEKPYSCETCKRRFTSKNTLNIHMKTHKGETFTCSICMKVFKYKCSLKLHLKTHSEYENFTTQIGEIFKCNACDTIYKNKNKLRKHIEKVHNDLTSEVKNTENKDSLTGTSTTQVETIFTCDLCDQKFNSKHNLKSHIEQAHNGLKHPCPKCSRQFQYKYRVTKHLRICTGERKTGIRIFKCDICNRVFNTKRNLKNHVMIHTGEKPFVCDRCGKKFRHKVNLTKHALLHTGEQYPCEHCDKKFNSREYLKVHTRVHTGKMFPCELCEWKFTRTSELRAHRRVHTGERPFPCEVCNKHFSQKSKLKLHISRMHGEETERNKNYFKGLSIKV